ncbi:hypothetical protein [Delftia sp. PS-11]|uniref:hypothetical protein n=1 Tax=Delftia sp. PS-11 TaxID=2767222 RepID=UPI0024565308|nr:hypothetical protein [Delftia sp. PS-11]KAJ8743658.1 hypothetical protein H9T68_15790 [Delftia sp. PS-11]
MRTPAEIHAAEMAARQQVKQLTDEAKELRQQAKQCKVAVDAYGLRLKAKQLTEAAKEAREAAKNLHTEACNALERCAAEMTKRMPPDFPSWGIMKTRGYVKLLEIVSSNAKRQNPKLAIATAAHAALLGHDSWTDEHAHYYGALPKNPKSF